MPWRTRSAPCWRASASRRRTWWDSPSAAAWRWRWRCAPPSARVRCPTLVVAGADDATVALDLKEALARAIPGSRWVIVPGSGHATNADHPEAFNATLRDFLAAP